MPKRQDKAFAEHQGITLFHAARSNCSARVRLLLAEKALEWQSRTVSLQQKENRTAAYFAINPKGLVPSLIHDDWVVTESNDILYYLEENFPEPGFLPRASTERAEMDRWMEQSAALHVPGVKTLNYSRMNPTGTNAPSGDIERYKTLQTDAELVQFHEKVSSGFSAAETARAEEILTDALGTMNETLGNRLWLTGDMYSLADICWVTTMPTLGRSGFDLTPFEHIRAWYDRIAARPAYATAVTGWENTPR